MKKILFFAACTLASMSMMAAQPSVEFHYLPTAGDKNAKGDAFTTSDKVAVEADEVFITGTNFTVKNAYATTYKVVGMMTDTAYNTMMIGDTEVDYKIQRIQGQDNPKDAAGGNPGTSLLVPTQGACFKVEVSKAGVLMVAVKTTPNKAQFAYSDLTSAGGALAGTPNQFSYLTMSNNTSGTPIGNPDGCMQAFYQGDQFGELHGAPEMINTLYGNGGYNTNGVGVLMIQVDPIMSPYIIGTGGSKMMACGFGFVASDDANLANLTVVAKGCKDKDGNEHADVTLFNSSLMTNPNLKVQDCSYTPNYITVTGFMPDTWVADTVGYGQYSLKKKFGCYIWGDGITAAIHEMTVDKDNASKYSYKMALNPSTTSTINAIFINSHLVVTGEGEAAKGSVSIDWNGDANQTVDLTNITADICYIVTNQAAAKATAVVDEDCDGTTALKNVYENARIRKQLVNGALIITVDEKKFNALGAEL